MLVINGVAESQQDSQTVLHSQHAEQHEASQQKDDDFSPSNLERVPLRGMHQDQHGRSHTYVQKFTN